LAGKDGWFGSAAQLVARAFVGSYWRRRGGSTNGALSLDGCPGYEMLSAASVSNLIWTTLKVSHLHSTSAGQALTGLDFARAIFTQTLLLVALSGRTSLRTKYFRWDAISRGLKPNFLFFPYGATKEAA
jgi:hypothetical protein